MPGTIPNLTRKRNKLKASAKEASILATAERTLADQQHLVAHNLELLADDLTEQVAAVDAEIQVKSDLTT